MGEHVQKYEASPSGRVWQGEILSSLVEVRLELPTLTAELRKFNEVTHPFCVVLSQDCDIESDFRIRNNSGKGQELPNLLLCYAYEVDDLKSRTPPGKDIWKRVVQNKDERYHCLEKVPIAEDAEGHGVPSLAIDFKLYLTMPTDEVYARIENGTCKRRSKLRTPYLEHFVSRFFHYQFRIALPQAHDVPL